jgi:hypothetical protein
MLLALACALLLTAQAWVPASPPAAASRCAVQRGAFATRHLHHQHSRATRLVLAAGDFAGEKAFDQFLGELIFSPNEPAYDVAKNFDRASDPDFQAWLKARYSACSDLEERAALKSLAEIIDKVVAQIRQLQQEDDSIVDAEYADVGSSSAAPAAAAGTSVACPVVCGTASLL